MNPAETLQKPPQNAAVLEALGNPRLGAAIQNLHAKMYGPPPSAQPPILPRSNGALPPATGGYTYATRGRYGNG